MPNSFGGYLMSLARRIAPVLAVIAMAASLGGCAIPPIVSAVSYLTDGVMIATTGKSPGDMGLSLAVGKDCSTWRVFMEEDVCRDEVASTPEAVPADVARDEAVAEARLADGSGDEPARVAMADKAVDVAFQPPAADAGGVVAVLPRLSETLPVVSSSQRLAKLDHPAKGKPLVRVASAGTPDATVVVAGAASSRPRLAAHHRLRHRTAVASIKSHRRQSQLASATAHHRRHLVRAQAKHHHLAQSASRPRVAQAFVHHTPHHHHVAQAVHHPRPVIASAVAVPDVGAVMVPVSVGMSSEASGVAAIAATGPPAEPVE